MQTHSGGSTYGETMRNFVTTSLIATSCLMNVQAEEPKKKNVLFIIADDLTFTALSCYENKYGSTPNIDKLASEGVKFTKTYCQFPVCGPSRASFMFGYYPHATKMFGYNNGRKQVGDRPSWSEHFKNNGYEATRVSKIYHMGVPIDIERGHDGPDDARSWSQKFNSQGPEWKVPGEGELVQNNPDGIKPIRGGNVMTIVKADGDDLVHSDGKTAQKASELLREYKKSDKPFFLAVGFVRPHVPFVAPKEYFKTFSYKDILLPPVVNGDWDDIPKPGINYVTSKKAQMTQTQKKKAIAGYYASVSFMDAQVGKVLKTLKDEGLEDDTIVIFTSDHGFHLGEHDFWMKVSVHEESARVPLIIKVPGKKPAVCNSLTELVDLYPTVSELCGLPKQDNLQGKSVAKMLDDPTHEVRDAAFTVSRHGGAFHFLLRTHKWAYIQYGEDAEMGMELYDMEMDPQQFTSLAKSPHHQKVVEAFKQQLKEKLKKIRDNDL